MASSSSSSSKIKSVCVLSGYHLGGNNDFAQAADHLGSVMKNRKINLVYAGDRISLLDSAFKVSSEEPVLVAIFVNATTRKTGEIKVPSLTERLPKLLEQSDAVIALPGGLGTIGDIIQIGQGISKANHSKPIGILNVKGFFDGFLIFLDHLVQQGFMTPPVRQIFISDPDPDSLIDKLLAFEFKDKPVAALEERTKKRKIELDLDLKL